MPDRAIGVSNLSVEVTGHSTEAANLGVEVVNHNIEVSDLDVEVSDLNVEVQNPAVEVFDLDREVFQGNDEVSHHSVQSRRAGCPGTARLQTHEFIVELPTAGAIWIHHAA